MSVSVNVDSALSLMLTLSAAVFYKDVKDFIVQTRADEVFTIANAGGLPVGGLITGPNEATFSVHRPRNFDNARVHGAEVNLVYSFTELPGWLSGFGTRLSFMLTQQIQTFLEGTNVLGAENITTGRFDNQLLSYIDTGARWALGVRANF